MWYALEPMDDLNCANTEAILWARHDVCIRGQAALCNALGEATVIPQKRNERRSEAARCGRQCRRTVDHHGPYGLPRQLRIPDQRMVLLRRPSRRWSRLGHSLVSKTTVATRVAAYLRPREACKQGWQPTNALINTWSRAPCSDTTVAPPTFALNTRKEFFGLTKASTSADLFNLM